MAQEKPTGHSPLGASGAYRWMICAGSVGLSQGHSDPESDYAAEGTAAHALAAQCLEEGEDAWEYLGARYIAETEEFRGYAYKSEPPNDKPHGVDVSQEMTDAVQVYLEYIRETFPDRNQGNFFVERRFHCPSIHEFFYGQTDVAYLKYVETTGANAGVKYLHVADYKHGAGIVVDANDNPQLMYYAAGMLEDLNAWGAVDKVKMTIVQPRGFHFDGPIRTAEISTADLRAWVDYILKPAMDHALKSTDTKSGDHCRFCPARFRACPQLLRDMNEMEELMAQIQGKPAADLTNAEAARFLELFDLAKIVSKAANETIFNRLQAGAQVPGFKLGQARTNRVFKDAIEDGDKKITVEQAAREAFGDNAYNPRALKSPAEIEKLPLGKDFVTRWAQKPQGKLTVLKADDARPAVSRDTKSAFQPVSGSKTRGK